jgi:DNA-binding transcriptional regulator YiaG
VDENKPPELRQALDAVEDARTLAVNTVADAKTSQQALQIATELINAFRDASDEIGTLRAENAVRIRDEESLSLAALANRMGVSKARADQIVKLAQGKAAKSDE